MSAPTSRSASGRARSAAVPVPPGGAARRAVRPTGRRRRRRQGGWPAPQAPRARVHRDGGSGRAEEEQDAADRRPGDDAQTRRSGPGRVGAGQVVVADQARDDSGNARQIGGRGRRGQGGDHRCEQDRQPGRRYRDQQEHEREPDHVGDDHDAAAVEPVGEHPGERAERHERHNPGRRRDAHPQRRVSAVVDQHGQREIVEPITDLRHSQRRQQPAEGRVPQRRADRPRLGIPDDHGGHVP